MDEVSFLKNLDSLESVEAKGKIPESESSNRFSPRRLVVAPNTAFRP